MENEEKEPARYTEADLRASFLTGTKLWLSQNAAYFFLFFGAGICVGFLLAITAFAPARCMA